MHIEEHDLILGLHDLDHVLGEPSDLGRHLQQSPAIREMCGSDAFLEVLDQSGELWMAGITPFEDDRPIREQLKAIGVQRIVIRLDHVMTAGPGVDMGCHPVGES